MSRAPMTDREFVATLDPNREIPPSLPRKDVGEKYAPLLDAVQIAALVRRELRAALAEGALPPATITVRCEGRTYIRVTVATRNVADDTPALRGRLARMLAAYQHKESDPMSDYLNANFLFRVEGAA